MGCQLLCFGGILLFISLSVFGSGSDVHVEMHDTTNIFGIKLKLGENAENSVAKILEQGSLPCGVDRCNCSLEILQHAKIDSNQQGLTARNIEDLSAIFIHNFLYYKSICDIPKQQCWNFESCLMEISPDVDGADVRASISSILTRLNMVLTSDSNAECYSTSSILQELENSNQSRVTNMDKVRYLFTIIVTHVTKGHCFDVGGSKADFLNEIFHMYGEKCSTVIKISGLKRLMHDLQSKDLDHDHNHGHANGHDHNHDHSEYHPPHHHSDETDCGHAEAHAHHSHDHDHRGENHDHENYSNNQNDHIHNHDHNRDHNHEHDQDHKYDHDHEHNHDHNHDHDHDHHHDHDHDTYKHEDVPNNKDNHTDVHDHNHEGTYNNEQFQNIRNHDGNNAENGKPYENSTLEPNDTLKSNQRQDKFKNVNDNNNNTNQNSTIYAHTSDSEYYGNERSSDNKNETNRFNRHNDDELGDLHENKSVYNNSKLELQINGEIEREFPVNNGDGTATKNSRDVQDQKLGIIPRTQDSINSDISSGQTDGDQFGENSSEDKSNSHPTPSFPENLTPSANQDSKWDLPSSSESDADDSSEKITPLAPSFNSSLSEGISENDLLASSSLKSEFFHHEGSGSDGNRNLIHNITKSFGNFKMERGSSLKPQMQREDDFHDIHVGANNRNLATKCLSTEELVDIFGTVSNTSLTRMEFLMMCPALVQQIVTGVCQQTVTVVRQRIIPSAWEVYGYSILSVFLISLTSLAGVVLLPVLKKNVYHYIMAGCIGLAFSTLAGDALFHLIPEALNIHSHNHDDPAHTHEDNHHDPNLWKLVGIFLAVYALYVFESTMCAFSKNSQHSHDQNKNGHSHRHITDAKELALVSIKVQSESRNHLALSPQQSASSLDTEIAENDVTKKPDAAMLNFPTICGLSTLALLVTLGDSIHNFGDGLAIGAAFSSGISSGLSTSIAVFCHELPHEFGDFVILLSSGLTFSKALWINFASGLTCLLGLLIGLQIGVNDDARMWIMAITAGIFLYVAMAEMLPELKQNKKGGPVKMLIVKNIGILTGMMIMILISVYEHQLGV